MSLLISKLNIELKKKLVALDVLSTSKYLPKEDIKNKHETA